MKNLMVEINRRGGLAALEREPLRLESGAYMRLVVEAVGTGPRGLPLVSVAHYFEQNGDLMADPDMVFEVAADGSMHPISFQQDSLGVYQVAVRRDDAGRTLVAPRLLADLRAFARQWDRNLKAQGFFGQKIAAEITATTGGN